MMQEPDIGKMIFEHTSDSHVIEWPFGYETHLPTGWSLFGIDVSPTKHVVFMLLAAVLVFAGWMNVLSFPIMGRAEIRHAEIRPTEFRPAPVARAQEPLRLNFK